MGPRGRIRLNPVNEFRAVEAKVATFKGWGFVLIPSMNSGQLKPFGCSFGGNHWVLIPSMNSGQLKQEIDFCVESLRLNPVNEFRAVEAGIG